MSEEKRYSLRARKEFEELFFALNCWNCPKLIPVERTTWSMFEPNVYRVPPPKSLPKIFSAKCDTCNDVRTCVTEREWERDILRPEWFDPGTSVAEIREVFREKE